MTSPKIALVKFENRTLVDSITLEVESVDVIEHSIHKLMGEGMTSAIAIFDVRGKWDIQLPMTDEEVKKEAKNIYRNLI